MGFEVTIVEILEEANGELERARKAGLVREKVGVAAHAV